MVYLFRGVLAVLLLLPKGPPLSSASRSRSLTDMVWDAKDWSASSTGGKCRGVSEASAAGVEEMASFWSADSRVACVWLMERFMDGETWKMSRDSSKKVGRGAGCKAVPSFRDLWEGSTLVSTLLFSMLSPARPWLGWIGWEVSMFAFSVAASIVALLRVNCQHVLVFGEGRFGLTPLFSSCFF